MTDKDYPDVRTELLEISGHLGDVREKLYEEGEKRDIRIALTEQSIKDWKKESEDSKRLSKWALGIAAIVSVLLIVVSIILGVAVDAIIVSNNQRKDRSLAACLQANAQTARSVVAAEATSDDLIDQLAAGVASDPKTDLKKLEEAVLKAKARQHKVIEENYPVRDCSPEGLKKFYSKQAEPSTTTTDGKTTH